MKKTALIIIMMVYVLASIPGLNASEYRTYEEITFKSSSFKLLEDYSETDYELAYEEIEKRRFWGWKTHTVLNNKRVSFKKETMMIIRNEGTSPIEKEYTFKTKTTSTTQLSASGSIGIEAEGPVQTFKTGLDSELEFSVDSKTHSSEEETIEIAIEIDPMTELRIEVYGEGKISNGVGKLYRFFRNTKKGGWEVFTLTSQYYSIEKVMIEK